MVKRQAGALVVMLETASSSACSRRAGSSLCGANDHRLGVYRVSGWLNHGTGFLDLEQISTGLNRYFPGCLDEEI